MKNVRLQNELENKLIDHIQRAIDGKITFSDLQGVMMAFVKTECLDRQDRIDELVLSNLVCTNKNTKLALASKQEDKRTHKSIYNVPEEVAEEIEKYEKEND